MSLILKVMERVLPLVGAESDMGRAVIDAMKTISKAVPQGSVPPSMENNFLQGMMQRRAQMAPQIAAMQGKPPGMPGGAPPTPPMPGGGQMAA